MKTSERNTRFARQTDSYFATRKNKRYGRDQIAYEESWVGRVVRGFRERENLTFRIRHNYAFLTSTPRWREIFATEFEGRRADHELCDAIMPYVEQELSPRTYNNRRGKGQQAAINQVIEDMAEVTCGYTREGWVIKVDIRAFFPSALWDYAEQCILGVIDRHEAELTADGCAPGFLRWLTMVLIHANPAAHCERRSPSHLWSAHIPADKSLFAKPEGVGAAIGRLTWQTAMALYVNDEVRWLNETAGVRAVCFVDDIVIQVPAERKAYTLALLPELRRRLAAKNLQMNDRKFYCQPCRHGLEFLGSHIRPFRLHLNNSTYRRAAERIAQLNDIGDKYGHTDELMASVNSYTGLLKNRTDYRRTRQMLALVDREWFRFVGWDTRRQCIVCRQGYSHRDRIVRKYSLKTKRQ